MSRDLQMQFAWAYKVVYTRTFDVGHPKGMLIPLAVNMNHDEYDMSYLEKTREWLLDPQQDEKRTTDFSDFDGVRQRIATVENRGRQHKGRLVKYLMENPDGGRLRDVQVIDEIDPVLKGYVSSSGEEDEDLVEVSDSDSDSEPAPSVCDSYFIVATGKRCFYPRDSQVFTRYGREGNTSLLLNFAFVLRKNCHDCLKVKLWDSGYEDKPHNGQFPVAHFSRQLKENASLYKVRKDKLSEDLLVYNRKRIIDELREHPEIGDVGHIMYTVPSDECIELQTLRRTMVLLKAIDRNRFKTAIASDKALLQTDIPYRLRFAVRPKQLRYRIIQHRILINQMRLLGRLIGLFERICAGEAFEEVTRTAGDVLKIGELYPFKGYLRKFRAEKEWRMTGQYVAAGIIDK